MDYRRRKASRWHPETPEERFWLKVDKNGPIIRSDLGPCWTWLGAKGHHGYGRFRVGDKTVSAHRFAYEILVGPIPAGLEPDHLCRNPACVNPGHLEPVTHQMNNQRGDKQNLGKAERSRTHCPQGHPYDAANTYIDRNGSRHCRTCNREKNRRRQYG